MVIISMDLWMVIYVCIWLRVITFEAVRRYYGNRTS